MSSPLRRHIELLEIEDEPAIEEKVAEIRGAREVIDGKPIGRALDIRAVDGQVRGPVMNEDDSEPSDDHIDTGFRLADFEKGKISVVTAC